MLPGFSLWIDLMQMTEADVKSSGDTVWLLWETENVSHITDGTMG